jgi:hypothetical protein
LSQAIYIFIDSEVTIENMVSSGTDFLYNVECMRLSRYEKDFGIFVTRDLVNNTDNNDLLKPFD